MKKILLCLFLSIQFWGYSQDTLRKDNKEIDDSIKIQDKSVDTIQIAKVNPEINNANLYILAEKSNDNFKTVLPILTLILGIFLNRIIDFFIDRKRINKSGKQWKAELICLESPIDIQLESLKVHKASIENSSEEIPILTYSSALNCENFAVLSKPDLLEYFEKKDKLDYITSTQLLSRITVLVTNTKDTNEILKDKFKSYLDGTSSAYTELSLNLGKQQKAYLKFLAEFETKEGITQEETNTVQLIDDLFIKYIVPHLKDGKYSIKVLSEEFYEQYIPILGHNRQNSMFSELTEIAFDAMTSIKKIEMEKTYWLTNIDTICQLYSNQKEALNKLLEEMNKKNCA